MNIDSNTDADLVELYKSGDKKALATLVKRWHKSFCDKAYWMVRDKDIAKDIAQDSWTIIMKRIHTLKNPNQFKFWALRIVCNKSTDWLRIEAKKKNQTLGYRIEIKGDKTDYSDNKQKKKILLKAVNDLPIHQQTVVRLFYLESYSLKQISQLLGISIGTTKSRLFHAREKIKQTLKHINYEN